jgi:queuine/archaeosine tRNA-ribosyltransferase
MRLDRPEEIILGETTLPLPVFFPSISTIKTALSPADYLGTLCSLIDVNKHFLVSAFDLHNSDDGESVAKALKTAQESGATVLMDSGNYESYWKGAQAIWTQVNYHDVLRRFPSSFAFSFDNQTPPLDIDSHVALLTGSWQRDRAVAGQPIIPIVHGTAETLPILCVRVEQFTHAPMIAVPERRLGDGVFDRTRSVISLRKALDSTGHYVGLHLLGTGNPISIALYAWAGADSFDGLEWCQTVVDHDTALLYHLSQSDFFRTQTEWGDDDLSFHARTLAHNLLFYTDWIQRLRRSIRNGEIISFCRLNFPSRVFRQCAKEFGWEGVG